MPGLQHVASQESRKKQKQKLAVQPSLSQVQRAFWELSPSDSPRGLLLLGALLFAS